MFKGFILSESLNNATVLNNYKQFSVKVEKHNDPKYPKFWHLFKLSIPESKIDKVVKKISNSIKNEWYAHFWDKNKVCIIFQNKIFWIPREKHWSSEKYKGVVKYAVKSGIDKKYLDFWIDD